MNDSELQSSGLHLLSLANTIRCYEDALTRANGEQFNLFDILHVGHYEVRTHSPILAELLDPRGSHGQGAVFLLQFIADRKITEFDAASARIRTEESIGELGRLDIVITDRNNRRIFIENKIYAGEQEDQLERYHTYDPKANLLFLTLNGDDPKNWLTNSIYQEDHFKSVFEKVSYKIDIVQWLEACRKEAVNAPTVRETITQYIHLIQQLTHQNTNTRMNHELTSAVLQNKATYLAYATLCKAERSVQKSILAKLKEELESVATDLGLTLNFPDSDLSKSYDGFSFRNTAMDAQQISILFQFQQRNLGACFFGFCKSTARAVCPLQDSLFQALNAIFPSAKSRREWWVGFVSWDQHSQWGEETMAAIQFGSFHTEVREIVEKLLRAFEAGAQVCAPSN